MKEIWQKFLHWRGWRACADGWLAFLRWKGWKRFAGWSGWQRFAQWKVWHLHPVLLLVLTVLSAAALLWIFTEGREQSLLAYPVYCLAAYSLTVLCVGTPRIVRWIRTTVLTNQWIRPLIEDENKRFLLDLFREEIVNLCYGLFKFVYGILLGTVFMWADGLYNLIQGVIQLFQLVRHRKHLPLNRQWKSYRLCGWLILAMHLTMTGVVFLMIRGEAEEYPGFMIFATAAFAFYKLISSFVDVARDRKHTSPVDASVRLLDLTQALFSLFSLQTALLSAFNDGSVNTVLMNSLTGVTVCLMVMGTGVYMIRRANREIKRIEESENGRIV